jgi:AcrR family transcriptional regulator
MIRPKPIHGSAAVERGARERILDAAFEVLRERGYAATNTREIAARAQVSKREIYTEFKSKQGIFAAMISARAARLRQPFEQALIGDRAQLATTLQRIAGSLLDVLSDPAVIAMFRLAISAAGDSSVIARVLEDNARAPNRKALTELMARAGTTGLLTGDAPVLVAHFVALVVGDLHVSLLLGLVTPPAPRELERQAAAATEAFLQLHGRP